MADVIHARLSAEIAEPELSKMWESERTTVTPGTGDGIQTWLTAERPDAHESRRALG